MIGPQLAEAFPPFLSAKQHSTHTITDNDIVTICSFSYRELETLLEDEFTPMQQIQGISDNSLLEVVENFTRPVGTFLLNLASGSLSLLCWI